MFNKVFKIFISIDVSYPLENKKYSPKYYLDAHFLKWIIYDSFIVVYFKNTK